MQEGIDELSDGAYTTVLNEQRNTIQDRKKAQQDLDTSQELVNDLVAADVLRKITEYSNHELILKASQMINARLQAMRAEHLSNMARVA